MTSKQDFLDRVAPLVPMPDRPLDRFHRLRERKRRNERIRAGALAIALVLAGVVLAADAIRSRDRTGDGPTPEPVESFQRRDGEILRAAGDLFAVNPKTGEERVLIDRDFLAPGEIDHAAWSADGRWVAYDLRIASSLWIASREQEVHRVARPSGRWAWSPTDARLALMRGSRLTVIDAATGRETDLGSTSADEDTIGPVWSPDGTRILFGVRGGTLYSVDAANGDRSVFVRLEGGELDSVDGIEWSPDGDHVAIPMYLDVGHVRLYVTDGDGSNQRVLVEDLHPGGWSVWASDPSPDTAWSPDGTQLLYADFSAPNDRRLEIWTASIDGSAPRRIAWNLNDECCIDGGGPAWSPDGSHIAFETDRRLVVVDAEGKGDLGPIDRLTYLSWRNVGGWYWCGCYG